MSEEDYAKAKKEVSDKVIVSYDEIINKESSIIIIGTYFTGIAIAKYLSANGFKNIAVVDIYPHLEGFIDSPLGNPIDSNGIFIGDNECSLERFNEDIRFSSVADWLNIVDSLNVNNTSVFFFSFKWSAFSLIDASSLESITSSLVIDGDFTLLYLLFLFTFV